MISGILSRELISRGHTVVVVLVGSEESKITIENTVKTLQSFDVISRKQVKQPIVISYVHNSKDTSRSKNDETVKQTINALSVLCSRQNKELDTADVNNFINFHNVTSVKEGISFLYVTNDEKVASEVEYPISIASLFSTYGKTADNLTPEYSCVGYPETEVIKDSDLHFVISQYDIKNVFNQLSSRLKEYEEKSSARVATASIGGDVDDDTGLVL